MNMPSPLLSPALLVPGLIVEGIVRARNGLYSRGVLARHRLPRPVISIGNITLGGSGKTPLVIHSAKLLLDLGAQPALLSRGYGRSDVHKVHVLPPGTEISSPYSALGDEPALIRRRVPELWLGISKDRFRTARSILRERSDVVFILDDGYQHRRLERTLDIMVIDCSQPLADNHIFPRGTLREPLEYINRAHVIILNTGSSPAPRNGLESVVRRYSPHAPILHCRQAIEFIAPFSTWRENAPPEGAPPKGRRAFLVAAVGNPERFQRDAEKSGIEVCGSRYFRDHYRIGPQDWHACAEEARTRKADYLLTTEKDAIKMGHPGSYPLMVAVQSVCLPEEDRFRILLRQAIGNYL